MKIQKDPRLIIEMINRQRASNTRPTPSDTLVTNGNLLEEDIRIGLVDACAKLTDYNNTGRSDMCIYFSCLLRYALRLLGHKAEVHVGDATYYGDDGDSFVWGHSWVKCEQVIIDGNVDSMIENPYVPYGIHPNPYWGDIDKIPADRVFNSRRLIKVSDEEEELDEGYFDWKTRLKKFMKLNELIN